jgi:polar amino acid transport system substrate-binding protein
MHTTRRTLLRRAAGSVAAVGVAGLPLFNIARAATLPEIQKRGYMVVATEDDFRPFEFVKDGNPTGFDSELLKIMRKSTPFKIQQEIIPWTGLLPGVDTGKYDAAVTGALITVERQKFLDFCSPVAVAVDYYLKRKNDHSINSVKDLNGKICGVEAGSALLAKLPELEAMLEKDGGKMGKVVQYVSYPEAYQDLALGRVDYVVNTLINLQTIVHEKPNVFALGQAVSNKTYIAWAVKKGNTTLLEYFNAFLLKQRQNGQMYALQKKWLGQSFTDMPMSWTATS